jgi:AmmeMemoRadiSam system protein B
MNATRQPAVAGAFYPADPITLAEEVAALLAAAFAAPAEIPKALIVPHAGYIYSGPIAASAYARLKPARATIRRVVLLGPSHRAPVDGLALPGASVFATPLGEVVIDKGAVEAVNRLPQVKEVPAAHRWEHSLEVQLPFLQTVLDEFTLLPLAVGDATAQEVAEVLNVLWDGPETLILVSSDLSHYLPYETARKTDRATAEAIVALGGPIGLHQACGGIPVNGLIAVARRHGLEPRLLDLRNSGDTAGDKSQVVGYGAFAFHEPRHAAQ